MIGKCIVCKNEIESSSFYHTFSGLYVCEKCYVKKGD